MHNETKELQALQTLDTSALGALIQYAPEHRGMLQTIQANLPEIHRATSFFGKTQSHFMDTMLTVSHTTPLRNLRQILAQIERSKGALREAYFKAEKSKVEIEFKKEALAGEAHPLKKKMIEIEIAEMQTQAQESGVYISGAVRQVTGYIAQYNSILAAWKKKTGKETFNEEDFELEEEQYHIQKAFEQGVTAARSRQGIVDEGNMIYFTQIGINGACAQNDVYQYLGREGKALADHYKDTTKPLPTHQMFLEFLEEMSKKYAGCSKAYAAYKGMTGTYTAEAMLTEGDTRLKLEK